MTYEISTTKRVILLIGYGTGSLNKTCSLNVFVGYEAGHTETGSNKLYIHNYSTSSPLIYSGLGT